MLVTRKDPDLEPDPYPDLFIRITDPDPGGQFFMDPPDPDPRTKKNNEKMLHNYETCGKIFPLL